MTVVHTSANTRSIQSEHGTDTFISNHQIIKPPRVASVNEILVSEGLARVEKRVTNLPLAEAMETARHARAGMWEYGDVDSDDDEPEGGGAKPGAWGRRR